MCASLREWLSLLTGEHGTRLRWLSECGGRSGWLRMVIRVRVVGSTSRCGGRPVCTARAAEPCGDSEALSAVDTEGLATHGIHVPPAESSLRGTRFTSRSYQRPLAWRLRPLTIAGLPGRTSIRKSGHDRTPHASPKPLAAAGVSAGAQLLGPAGGARAANIRNRAPTTLDHRLHRTPVAVRCCGIPRRCSTP